MDTGIDTIIDIRSRIDVETGIDNLAHWVCCRLSRVRSDDDLWWRHLARGGSARACGGASQPAVEELRVGPSRSRSQLTRRVSVNTLAAAAGLRRFR